MVVAGNETTTKLLGNAVFHGQLHEAELATVYADPARFGAWVEETLRFDTSTQMLARHTTRDAEVGGTVIPAGSKVLLLPGSANRDETVFPAADRYDLGRDTSAMLSFGVGRHYCLGAHLARLEAQVALGYIVSQVTGFAVDVERAERVHSVNVRGFSSLPMSVSG